MCFLVHRLFDEVRRGGRKERRRKERRRKERRRKEDSEMYMEIVPPVEQEKGTVNFPRKTEMDSQRTWRLIFDPKCS